MKARIIGSIKFYGWLTSSEYLNLSEIKLLVLDWTFTVTSSEYRVCIHCNSNQTNWSIVENVFLNELVLSGRNDENLCKSCQIVEFHRSVSKHVHSFLVRGIRRVQSEQPTIPRLTLGLSLILWKLGLALISCSLSFIFGSSSSEVERSQPPVYHIT